MKFTRKMRTKLLVMFALFMLVFCGLSGRLLYIEYTSGDKYQKIVLAQQSYDSVTIPYQRGDIVDTNGTVLATSLAVYNVILDCYVMTSKADYITPTIDALTECFPDLERSKLEDYAENSKDSRYIVLEKQVSYDEIQPLVEMMEAVDEKGKLVNPNINGIWFEKEYQRKYPLETLASSMVGFVSKAGDSGTTGLEYYYNDTLTGTNGREYGYLSSDSTLAKTVIDAENGKTLMLSIDANIQSVVEAKIQEFNEAYRDNYRSGAGSENTAVIVMNPNNGEILAMADYPGFDLNDPWNLDAVYGEGTTEKLSDEDASALLNALWQNYCVTKTYEPGSVQKPLTVACGIETGTLTTNMTFECDGYETISGSTIHCVSRSGHGTETLKKALMDSCNDALMQMSYKIGVHNFSVYQSIFGFGQKTGIDLPGEASASTLIYTEDNMTKVDLATNVFGQNYNCTMVQMASAFSSLINGGTYYQPHVVRKIMDSDGNTVTKAEPVIVRQTVSQSTSDLLRSYLYSVVSEGTGSTAKVDGYSMGGKTGTAETIDETTHLRSDEDYLVSFIGFAPYENPQLVIYCIIDRPNVKDQPHSAYAQNVVREILEEILPYMNIYPDEEELTGANADLDITGEYAPGPDTNGSDEEPQGE